jgi:hypothetical protein
MKIAHSIKIGFTTDLHRRLVEFQCTSPHTISVLATFPGGQALERRFHKLFAHLRIQSELFHDDNEIVHLIDLAKYKSLAFAIDHLETQKRRHEAYRAQQNHKRKVVGRNPPEAQYQEVVAQRIRDRQLLLRARKQNKNYPTTEPTFTQQPL